MSDEADQIAAYLQAHPDLAVKVVGRLRIATAWTDPAHRRQHRSQLGDPYDPEVAVVYAREPGGPYEWYADAQYGTCETAAEARAAADAVLVAAGAALVHS